MTNRIILKAHPLADSKVLQLVKSQDKKDAAKRRALIRKIWNDQCVESGLFHMMDFSEDGTSL
jgi:hypothetical protein